MDFLKENINSSPTHAGTSSAAMGESELYTDVPWWAYWISTAILSLTFVIGLPLNGATVLIFCRRKKLRHLVNFVLLLDCLSHIVLCLLCIPIHLVTVWSGSSFAPITPSGNILGLVSLQQVIGNFVNLYSTFLTVSIAILRYRRLCWKKKDKFSTVNALKWSVSSGILAIGVTFVQFYFLLLPEGDKRIAIIYCVKISLILLAVATVFFCYIRVSQRVWANTANQEKIMDPAKLKKSRSVHLKATIHSCVQIALVIITVTPHLYLQAVELFAVSSNDVQQSFLSSNMDHVIAAEPVVSAASQQQHHQPLLSINHPQEITGAGAAGWIDTTLSFSRHPLSHHESLSGSVNTEAFEVINNSSSDGSNGDSTAERGIPLGISATAATVATHLTTFGASNLARLIAITVNYALLALGTPCAYIASCHRFREQFASILFSHVGNSPQNSTCHHQNGHHQHSSPGHKSHHHRDRYYHHRSTTGGTQDACFSSPLTRADRTGTTTLHNHSSMISKTSSNGRTSSILGNGSSIRGESVSISISANTTNSRSSFSHSFKSKNSTRKSSVCGSSMMRRKSSTTGVGSCSGKGLLGVSAAADSVFLESDSALILDQDLSNGSSSTGNLKRSSTPSPSPTGGDEVSGRGSSGELVRKNSSNNTNPLPLTAVTTITSNSTNLHTYLQNYGSYECSTDLGQLV
ncbi:unnamed protein product [Orchesella dallaii]|uniref:G-protein coupled receptors family 1 profile domain-containing protein n=1 Tax=Orchesella dallaii TaxID=48710 RepID=A0ABP1S5R5_9HEXA